jgi:hypothetical protein
VEAHASRGTRGNSFIGHLVLALLLVSLLWVFERFFHFLWGAHEPLLFGKVPLKWLFDAMDLSLLLVFGVWGVIEANHKLKH